MRISVGFSRRQAASYLNVEHNVISRAVGRDEEFAHNRRRAEDLSAVQPLLALIDESQKNWRAAAWLMEFKRKHPPRLSEEEKEERQQRRLPDKRRRSSCRAR